MAKPVADPVYERLRALVLALPGTKETFTWGSPHFRVGPANKIFCGYGLEHGTPRMGVKTEKPLQAMLVASDPRFRIAAYVGKHGWIDMRLDGKLDWAEIEMFVVGSYRLIAPSKLVAALDARGGATPAAPAPRRSPRAKPARTGSARSPSPRRRSPPRPRTPGKK